MGLDQRLIWIGKISRDEKALLQDREAYPRREGYQNSCKIFLHDLGISEIHKSDLTIEIYKHIKSFLTPVKMIVRETDWDKVKNDCNVS